MASQEEIRQTILKVAGNPDSGSIKALADTMARAIVELDNPPAQPTKEKRVSHPAEVR
jgi:hypothetical protein